MHSRPLVTQTIPALLTPPEPPPMKFPLLWLRQVCPRLYSPHPTISPMSQTSPILAVTRPNRISRRFHSEMKIPNAAGLSMQILPGPDIVAGSQVSFQISSKKAGYLILVDVDATGKLVQIYPNPMSLMGPSGVREQSNYLRPGKALQIPDRQSRLFRI